MARFNRRDALILIVALIVAPVVILGRLWWGAVSGAERRQQADPFRIAGDFYFVGANDVTSFLLTGPEGHVLIDGGRPGTAAMIMESVASLGFDIKDVKVLLNSSPERDYAGGLAELQKASGARLWASEASAGTIASGGDDPAIPWPLSTLGQFGVLRYPAARVDNTLKDGGTIRVGPIALTPHVTGGSTRGCTSWTFDVRDVFNGETRVLKVVHACELQGSRGFRYAEQHADIERSLRVLRNLPADIWVTSRGRPWGRYRKSVASQEAKKAAKNPVDAFIDPDGYRAYLAAAEEEFRGGVH